MRVSSGLLPVGLEDHVVAPRCVSLHPRYLLSISRVAGACCPLFEHVEASAKQPSCLVVHVRLARPHSDAFVSLQITLSHRPEKADAGTLAARGTSFIKRCRARGKHVSCSRRHDVGRGMADCRHRQWQRYARPLYRPGMLRQSVAVCHWRTSLCCACDTPYHHMRLLASSFASLGNSLTPQCYHSHAHAYSARVPLTALWRGSHSHVPWPPARTTAFSCRLHQGRDRRRHVPARTGAHPRRSDDGRWGPKG